jgi:hypothetical protein
MLMVISAIVVIEMLSLANMTRPAQHDYNCGEYLTQREAFQLRKIAPPMHVWSNPPKHNAFQPAY